MNQRTGDLVGWLGGHHPTVRFLLNLQRTMRETSSSSMSMLLRAKITTKLMPPACAETKGTEGTEGAEDTLRLTTRTDLARSAPQSSATQKQRPCVSLEGLLIAYVFFSIGYARLSYIVT